MFDMFLRGIIGFCIREWLVVLVLLAAVIGFGWYSTQQVPIDAIPNIGENQVIVFTAWPGQSPKDVEDQITYKLSTSLLKVPGARSVRGKSLFGYSFVQVTFADGVDFYWARSRVAEQLGSIASDLPEGVTPTMGPDATALGQVFYYVLDAPPHMNLAELRSLQDFVIKYALQSVEGVSEVASVGGYVRQYQIEVDPNKLRFHNVPLDKVIKAIKQSNIDVGAKTVEVGGMEYIVRGKGFIGRSQDINKAIQEVENTVVITRKGIPVRIKDLAYVQAGPDFRRGAIDLNGSEAVGGMVVMRFGENPRAVIDRVKAKIKQLEPSLGGVKIRGIYDRTGLVNETVGTLTTALRDEVIITIVVILLFLLHIRSSIVVATTLPVAVLIAFIAMNLFNIDANIMSLAGIAIAIGTMVDMGIIVSENIYRHLADWETSGSPGGREQRLKVIHEAASEVAPAVMTAVSTTVVSFLPVFFLTGRDYKLFAPLAWTKTFALVASLIVAVTLVPFLSRVFLSSSSWRRGKSVAAGILLAILLGTTCYFLWGHRFADWPLIGNRIVLTALSALGGLVAGYALTREKLRPMDESPVSRLIAWTYEPVLRFLLRHKLAFLVVPVIVVLVGIAAYGPYLYESVPVERELIYAGKAVGMWPAGEKNYRINLISMLRPVELAARHLGADFNQLPGYVDFKHMFPGLESDAWIALDEGSWFYMPTLYPAASFSQAMQVLQTQDVLIKQIPEVDNVLGKIGRIESALDPAPATMVETYVMLKPRDQWREGMTPKKIWDEINRVAALPGVTPASPLQPIEGRVVMLQSGIKAPMAVRVYGDDLDKLAKASFAVAAQLKKIPEVDAGTVNPDIVLGKPYVEFDIDRETAARYGMTTQMVNQVIATAIGGMNITTTVEGRERYPIRVRYERDLREQVEELRGLPVVTQTGEVVPLQTLAKMETTWGPAAISSEDARLVAHISFSPSGIVGDLKSVDAVMEALNKSLQKEQVDPQQAGRIVGLLGSPMGQGPLLAMSALDRGKVEGKLQLPAGYELQPVGSFQSQIEANQRLLFLVPLVILINLFIIYLQFRHLPITLAVFSGIPVAFAGGMILLALYQVKMNTAIWVGFIALFGIAVDDGVVIATYLDQVFTRRWLRTVQDIRNATVEAGLKRIRPCLMTTFTTIAALIPVLLATGRGADIARAMALPVFGGMLVELLTLFVVPVLYCGFKEFKLQAGLHDRHWVGTEPHPEDETKAAEVST